ncbi:ketopantoate reductase family protein [Ktedonobacter sp. SOSP1-52]|uniref:ketopantoate reductase family protein n=1 Tax=Ktedonobacter sp. SOSP1-52 TaxID=2778366 RepID=UPI001916014B|nr:2-dehydropantoate 2-reductase N-terminal domain-containing protein [Ktedonobacter sp. SOSP1-52]
MNILVYGVGVIGSVYAALLQESGCNVVLLARGPRADALRLHSLLLEDAAFSGCPGGLPFCIGNMLCGRR